MKIIVSLSVILSAIVTTQPALATQTKQFEQRIHFNFPGADLSGQISEQAGLRDTLPPLDAYFSALIVRDIDQSIDWYVSKLGFELLNLNEVPQRSIRQANLKREQVLLELIELGSAMAPEEVVPDHTPKTRLIGIFKIGFMVSDFDEWIRHLQGLETHFNGNVVQDPNSGKKMAIILDPDGNRIQLFER